jgi:hypothetical protein
MSLKTKDCYHFGSFDTFGDDLCQLLLSYLSLSNKNVLNVFQNSGKV